MEKKESIWERDIAYDIVGVLAMFGLVVSSLVAGMGVATLGVKAQIAFAEHDSIASQTAAAFMGNSAEGTTRPAPRPMDAATPPSFNASSTPHEVRSALASSSAMYCPKISMALNRGGKDATSTGDVRELQRFIASHYGLEASSTITGYFGSTTAAYVTRFQQEQGIPPAPTVGSLTRAAISKVCMGGEKPPAMASSTPPMPPQREMMGTSTRHTEPPRPVSIQSYEGASNAAAVVSAVGEIGSGVGHLVLASLSLLGL
jgi:hypothetical protein